MISKACFAQLTEEKMTEKQTQFDWGFGLLWVVVMAVGTTVAVMIGFMVMWSVGDVVDQALGETAAALIGGGLFGVIVALGTSLGSGLLLHGWGVNAGRWIITSVVAGAAGMALGFTLTFILLDLDTMPEAVAGLIIGLSLGLPIGIGQRSVLRRSGLLANEWIVINTLAFVIAMAAGFSLGGEGREWLAMSVMGLLLGTLTGLGMIWLRRRHTAVAIQGG
jgi:hypothetical protein